MTSSSVLHSPWGGDADAERHALVVNGGRCTGRYPRLSYVGLPSVLEDQAPVDNPGLIAPLLLERVLDLEQVREIAGHVDSDLEIHGFVLMVEEPQLLVEAVCHLALVG